MTKRELLKILRTVPLDAVVAFRCADLGKDFPAEHFAFGSFTDLDDFARLQQGVDFILR